MVIRGIALYEVVRVGDDKVAIVDAISGEVWGYADNEEDAYHILEEMAK